jgi:hypothetical protein
MATKIPVAQNRLFGGVFICRNCNKKVRTQAVRILAGKITCPKCNGRVFRPVRKK